MSQATIAVPRSDALAHEGGVVGEVRYGAPCIWYAVIGWRLVQLPQDLER
jgi:hypothetical protein